ncbi:MAG: 1,4-dihydroxy-6-naphthoate synthase [Bacteroidales bacterium]|nr:1,4-dihydroxy-6-naphthoate synthase [Bacteroidales bacterium]
MKLKLCFSPCPNDTFIFHAMIHGLIDREGLEFEWSLADVEELNRRAFNADADITKISTHAYAWVADKYLILDSGSALGYGNGPLLVAKKSPEPSEINNFRIAIPGRLTTANLLFSIAYPAAKNKSEFLFSEIEEAVLNNKADAGILIHETRFTYETKGLIKLADLGEYWEKLTGLPVPLGNIAIKRSVHPEISAKVNRIIRRSIEYAIENPDASLDFITSNSRETSPEIVRKHIELYVNDFTLDLGQKGRKALSELFSIGSESGVLPELNFNIFNEIF